MYTNYDFVSIQDPSYYKWRYEHWLRFITLAALKKHALMSVFAVKKWVNL